MELKIFLCRLFLALLLGAFIGVERQIKQRSAGLITNALVALGACTFILISESVAIKGSYDNLRVVAQIVTGIGFLGAGVIMRDGFTIHGLNTAATIWCSAAVGSLCGFGLYWEAAIAAGIIILAHLVLKPLADYFDKRPIKPIEIKNVGFSLVVITDIKNEMSLRSLLVDMISGYDNFQLQKMKSTQNSNSGQVELKMDILCYDKDNMLLKQLLVDMSKVQCIKEISTSTLTKKIEH